MRTHTTGFKNAIKSMGREIKSVITIGNDELVEELYHVNFSYDGNLLKSVMKKLEIESSVEIAKGTTLNYQFGVLVGNSYEFLDFGNFIVESVEKQEDTDNYKITCYDKMLLAMKEYKGINSTFPMSVRSYLGAICTKLGITFADGSTNFANYNRTIQNDLYADLDYTYRDVLDEIAQVTASTICINEDDELEVRYVTDSEDEIDEEFFKDVNVDFGSEKYGPINSIVLSRSAESDNVYLRDEDSVAQNGLCELKIIDNQIMNFNDRSDYLPDILNKMDGMEFFLNDYSSYGITYLDLCDRYSVSIRDNTYSCIMLNDEIDIEQGIEENVYTERLDESETDYTKADKTDRKINQTTLIVNKQEQQIQSLITQVGDRTGKTTSITQDVDRIESLVEETIDITREAEGTDPLTMSECMQGYLLELHIYGNNDVFSCLYPANNLYPSNSLYPKGDARIRVWTDNVCPSTGWENKAFTSGGETTNSTQSLISPYVEVSQLTAYVSLEDQDYSIYDICAYDEDKEYLSGTTEQIVEANYEEIVSLPQDTKYIRIMIKRRDLEDISIKEITSVKPMVTMGNTKIDYCGYNNTLVDLGVPSVLRRFVNASEEVIRDEYQLINNRGTLIRRVGVDSQRNLYDLQTEVKTDLGDMYIPIAEGKNYFEIVNYDAPCKARYVIINDYTSTFATTVQLSSAITQLADEINIQVSKKVDEDEYTAELQLLYNAINAKVSENEIIAELNLAIQEGQGIVTILGNLIKIATDYFKVNLDGTMEATGGRIGGFTIGQNSLESASVGISSNQYIALWTKIGNTDTFRLTWNGDIACSTILVDNSPLIKTNTGNQEIYSAYADNGQLVFYLKNASALWVVLPDGGSSDEKLKKNIEKTKIKALEEIEKMEFKEFTWKATDEFQDIGLVAQELEKINPSLVSTLELEEETQKVVNNSKLIYYSLKGVQELEEKVNRQQKEIDELKQIIKEMKGEK